MTLVWLIYLADVLPDIANGLKGAGGIGVCIFLFVTFFHTMEGSIKKHVKWLIPTILGFVFIMFLGTLIPSAKTMYTMAAVKYGQEVLETPEAKELGQKVYKILNEKLDGLVKK